MKYIDINKKFTEAVAEYMNKGYTINSATMRGSQGEITKIDLTNETEIIRVAIESFRDWRTCTEGLEIVVGRYTSSDVTPNTISGYNTIWAHDLEVLRTERFYKIGSNRTGEDFYGTEEESRNADALRHQRWTNKHTDRKQPVPTTGKALEIGRRVIRNRLGVKRINDADVRVTKSSHGYNVSYRGKSCSLR